MEDTEGAAAIDDPAAGLRLVVRPAHGPGIGVGHLTRCYALGQAWADLAGTVAFATGAPPPEPWTSRWAAEGFDVVVGDGWPDGHAFVLDGYGFGPADQRGAPGPLLVVDDLGQVEIARADLVLDQNLSAVARPGWPPGSELLLGPTYALLRRELLPGPTGPPVEPERPVVLVAAGGAPDPAWLDRLTAAVRAGATAAAREVEIVVADGHRDMGSLLAEVTAAVVAAGSTVWELLAHGVPSVVVAVADNQRPVARALGAEGLALDGGDHDEPDDARLRAAVGRLLADGDLRRRLSDRGRAAVDGRGAQRVARALALRATARPTPS